jgi:dolichol-phosphate mannosyltransferase
MRSTVIIPTFNEAQNLPGLTDELLNLSIDDIHLLVVDDNSPDGTGEIAEALKEKFPGKVSVIHRPGKLGFGTAYILGFKEALSEGTDIIIQMDADFSHSPRKIMEMEKALSTCDAVIGSRYVSGGSLDDRWPFWRKFLSNFANCYARLILGLEVRDITGGFRMWRRETLLGLPLERIKSNGYAFQIEMIYVATRLGYKFREIPIYFADRQWGDSKMSWRIQLEAAFRVWQMRFRYRDLKKKM